MKPNILFVLLAFSFSHVAFAQTLCEKGETDYLSCPTNGGKKILSMCSNIRDGTVDTDSWLQYRFGKKGNVELAYPQEKKGSLSAFEGYYADPREQLTAEVEIRFISGSSLYSVALDRTAIVGKKGGSQFSGGVQVALGNTRRVNIACDKVDGARYFEDFRHLSNVVGESGVQNDMLQRFYKNAAH
jgi:hypothetical protein